MKGEMIMKRKHLGVVFILVLIVLMTGCSKGGEPEKVSGKNEVNTEDVANVDESIEVEEPNDEPEVRESEIGKMTIVNINKEIGEVKESGPFSIQLNKVQVAKLEVDESYKSMFDDKDIVTIVTMEIEVENKDTGTNTIYPAQGTIVTNTKEQKESNIFLSDDVGGDFIGEVIKKGNVIFVLDSDAEEVTSFKYIISGPIDSNWDRIGEDITYEISF